MPKVNFKYDIKKDAWSWVLIAKGKDFFGLNKQEQISHIPNDLLFKIKKASFSKAQNIIENYLKNRSNKKYRDLIIKKELAGLGEIWRSREKKFFKILSKLTQKPIYRNNFDCYFTTGFMCPYSEKENWFMVSVWHSLSFSLTTISHELLHLQFLYYYRDYLKKKGLSDKKIEILKEVMTFILNESEFKEIILVQDRGYPNHKKLRNELKKIWRKTKNFQIFLDKAVDILKSIS